MWETLRETVIADIVERALPEAPIRAWVPGCATGEEAYSVAMLLIEEAEKQRQRGKIQVFATDIDRTALDIGRAGAYPVNINAIMPPERLRRFFVQEGKVYKVKKELREAVVFAPQNLAGDSPFSRVDLISCRNLLIYIELELQKRIIEVFHFALNDNGILVLGTSETVPQQQEGLFRPLSKKLHIYRRSAQARSGRLELPLQTPRVNRAAERNFEEMRCSTVMRRPPFSGACAGSR